MNFRIHQVILGVAFTVIGSLVFSGSANAQFPFEEFEEFDLNAPERVAQKPATESIEADSLPTESLPAESPRLVDEIPSSSDRSVGKPTVAEMRLARAQYRSQQRLERLERNQWMGYEPLRPSWNAVPMMSSRYPYQSTLYVPVYYYAR